MTMGILTDINGVVPQRAIRYIKTMPLFVSYDAEGVVDFGDTGDGGGFVFATPATMRGKPMQVDIYDNGETFAGTTKARVDIGDGSDQDEFALTDGFADGTAAQLFNVADGTLVIGDTEIIEPGDQVTVTCVDAITSTISGQAKVTLTMLYFK